MHYNIPPSSSFYTLGILTNDKPSAVFKLRMPKVTASTDEMMQDTNLDTIQLGISIEPIGTVLTMQKSPSVDMTPVSNPSEIVEKVVR